MSILVPQDAGREQPDRQLQLLHFYRASCSHRGTALLQWRENSSIKLYADGLCNFLAGRCCDSARAWLQPRPRVTMRMMRPPSVAGRRRGGSTISAFSWSVLCSAFGFFGNGTASDVRETAAAVSTVLANLEALEGRRGFPATGRELGHDVPALQIRRADLGSLQASSAPVPVRRACGHWGIACGIGRSRGRSHSPRVTVAPPGNVATGDTARRRVVRASIRYVSAFARAADRREFGPIIDTKSVDMASYQRDLAECQTYAEQVSGKAVGGWSRSAPRSAQLAVVAEPGAPGSAPSNGRRTVAASRTRKGRRGEQLPQRTRLQGAQLGALPCPRRR